MMLERSKSVGFKTIPSDGSGTDLASIWGSQGLESNTPPSSPVAKNSPTMFSLLSLNTPKSPKKSLYVPPRIDSPSPKKSRPKPVDYMYSSISLTSSQKVSFDSIYKSTTTYVYKGNENQNLAWEDFRRIVQDAEESIVATPNLVFQFKKKVVSAKALTSSAQTKLDKITDELSNIDIEKALSLIQDLSKVEKLSIYSTSPFNFSVVTPIHLKYTEVGSQLGPLHRYVFNGFIFPSTLDKFMHVYTDLGSVKRYTVVLH
ncbi:hypothetical protein TVAG_059080 [Trichomonas vaginalis G3]|uniref:Uncharacterized protein n=1 Tax=Trichomonas vaginalis (strain ATCC PRA-98 / G3) TaxID=412133 RepID=A2ERI3_TRIV3|nr:hypothetical protein TVAGG3_0284740 [Trichomonas vaginalis G3]EAY04710.1 hypothetical protein TVAG_059080 [Trichomonas vaginalis G3]KAI5526808.1 hypothetical protein TVAGG3_0284740 [Trichomonas vaginalis G3]|eukprot:XP_001316933.1 hypothetical protein [Trichomonas vaginalis G3]